MNRTQLLIFFLFLTALPAASQSVQTPDEVYAELFSDVQMNRMFSDSKTFVDCIPKREPREILADYRRLRRDSADRFSLANFVHKNFYLPLDGVTTYQTDTSASVKNHIAKLWGVLKRQPDSMVVGSSLLPLPNPYIVPGGRFREIYYWDSYFTMLGLQESKEYGMMENMLDNFAYLIKTYGHIPNGNRTYYLSRSQPPFFSLMVGLLAEAKGDGIYDKYLPALEKEYSYWMKAEPKQLNAYKTSRCVVKTRGGLINRYWDDLSIPRQESYFEDVETAKQTQRKRYVVYKNLRAGAASGWDFSSRWFADSKRISSIRTIDIVPVDLNSLLYNLERTLYTIYLKRGHPAKAAAYKTRFTQRANFINTYCWSAEDGCYYDYNFRTGKQVKTPTLAMVFPLFFKIASGSQARAVGNKIEKEFLKDGGLTTTLNDTGQQWDAPNGWAPLQWMAVKGFENYNQSSLAKEIALRWVRLNLKVFHSTGKLMEKYNVVNTALKAGGGEYPSQDGFGWTNGVLLKLMNVYGVQD